MAQDVRANDCWMINVPALVKSTLATATRQDGRAAARSSRPPLVDNIGEKYRVICAVNDDLFTEKNQDTDNKLAPRTAGADDPMWLARASSYPASALRFHRTSQAAARSGDARPAARRAPRRNAIGGLTADHRVVFGRLHDRPIRMARQAAAPGESPPPARVGSAARLAAQHRHVAARCSPNREVADRRNAPV
jgi:hypothetical protein